MICAVACLLVFTSYLVVYRPCLVSATVLYVYVSVSVCMCLLCYVVWVQCSRRVLYPMYLSRYRRQHFTWGAVTPGPGQLYAG